LLRISNYGSVASYGRYQGSEEVQDNERKGIYVT
jgi:hypothetical protein